MKSPLRHRKGIPFFHDKTEGEFQEDIYERYHEMVVKHAALHLADELWDNYPMQAVLDFASQNLRDYPASTVLEIGCGVGRWIATVAQNQPKAICWGIDYSYQMLKQAHEFWVSGHDLYIDLSNKGFHRAINIKGSSLDNLNFGLAKAADLPFSDNSQDVVLNSFLIDRLDDPRKGLIEIFRVLKPGGRMVLITPLNFYKASLWDDFYPPIKIHQILGQIGFNILDWKEEMIIEEPLDSRGNLLRWNCIAIAASKNNFN